MSVRVRAEKFRGTLGLAGLMTGLLVGPAWGSSGVPEWVHNAVAQPMPKVGATTKAVVLLDERTYTVGSDGRAVEHVRHVVKILRPQGRDYAYAAVPFDKDSKVTGFHVYSIDPAGHEYTVKDSEMAEMSPPGEGGELYDDIKFKVAEPPGRDPGGVIAYEYDRKVRPYLGEADWTFQDELPRVKQTITLVLPANYTFTSTVAHHAKVDPIDLESTGANKKYLWDLSHQDSIDLERIPMAPAAEAMQARLTVQYAGPGVPQGQEGTWQGIGKWYDGLAHDRLAATPEIAAKAAELTQGKTDFYDKAEAIGEFVQGKIRYFVIEMGVGGYQPHPAGDIFKGRYGDCKDKATVLSAMLSTVGIHSALMMVDTQRGVIDPAAPSIWGNHMIAAIEIPKGYENPKLRSVVTAKTGKRYLIFDPTWDKTPFGQLEKNLQGGYGVLLEGADTEAIALPLMSPEMNRVRRSATFQLASDGTLKGSVTEKRFGDLAETRRRIFLQADEKEQQKIMDRIAGDDFASVSLTGLKVENAAALNQDLTTRFDLAANHFATTAGPLLMVRPRVFGSLPLNVDTKPRMVPVDLRQTMEIADDFSIELPLGYVVDELPDPVKLDLGFASYVSSTEVKGNMLHYQRKYTQRQVTVPAEKYPELQRLAGLIANDEQSRAVLKKSP